MRLPSTGGSNTPAASNEAVVAPLLSSLANDRDSFPRTIIYPSLVMCGHIHHVAITRFGFDEFDSDVVQFHGPQSTNVSMMKLQALNKYTLK